MLYNCLYILIKIKIIRVDFKNVAQLYAVHNNSLKVS